MDHRHPLADPISDRSAGLKLEQLYASQRPQVLAGWPAVCADLDRHDIAVVLQASYEREGYREANALDAIAATKRGRK